MNAKQLKNSILQEAIMGHLVPQDPNEEPASILLERIRAEKQRLVKEGKLKKKDLEETPISDDEKPFEIPDSWEWVLLSMISLDSADGPFGSNLKVEHYTEKKEVRIIQLSNIGEEGWRDKNKKYTTFKHLETIARSEAFPNDIIIAKMMPAGRAIICPSDDIKYVLSSDAVRFDFSKEIDREYLYFAINSNIFKAQVYDNVQGITRVRTSLTKLRSYILPIPPLAEQKRIVAKIEELLPKVEEYGKAQDALDKLSAELPERLKKSILQEAIEGRLVPQDPNDEPASVLLERIRAEKQRLVKEGKLKKKDLIETPISDDEKPFEIPDSWEWCRFGQLVRLSIGKTPPRGDVKYWGNAIHPWVSISDMKDYGQIINTKEQVSNYAASSIMGNISLAGTLLMSFKLTVGRTSILNIDAFHNEAIVSIYPYIDKEFAFRNYLFYVLPLLSNKGESKDAIKGKTLNSKSMNELLIPFPPLSEQKRIVEKIEELFKHL